MALQHRSGSTKVEPYVMPMPPNYPKRKTESLRHGRVSIPEARYLVTCATDQRSPMLASPSAIAVAHQAAANLLEEADVTAVTLTVMPDHLHLLFQLGERLSLHRVVAKLKTRIKRDVAGLRWQANFFEHRLHPDESVEAYAWYIFMNPYEAGLITSERVWPGWWSRERFEFLELAREGPCPQPVWIREFRAKASRLKTGE